MKNEEFQLLMSKENGKKIFNIVRRLYYDTCLLEEKGKEKYIEKLRINLDKEIKELVESIEDFETKRKYLLIAVKFVAVACKNAREINGTIAYDVKELEKEIKAELCEKQGGHVYSKGIVGWERNADIFYERTCDRCGCKEPSEFAIYNNKEARHLEIKQLELRLKHLKEQE